VGEKSLEEGELRRKEEVKEAEGEREPGNLGEGEREREGEERKSFQNNLIGLIWTEEQKTFPRMQSRRAAAE
jgi:hypothetical protein